MIIVKKNIVSAQNSPRTPVFMLALASVTLVLMALSAVNTASGATPSSVASAPPSAYVDPVAVSLSHIAAPFADLPEESLSVASLYGGGSIIAHGTAPYSLPLGSTYYNAKQAAQGKIYSTLEGVTVWGSLTIGKGSKLLKVSPSQIIGNPSLCTSAQGDYVGLTHNYSVADVCLQTDYAKIATRLLSSDTLSRGIFNLIPDYKGDKRYVLPKMVTVSPRDSVVIDARGLRGSLSILPRVVTPMGEVVFTPLALNKTVLNQGKYYTFQTGSSSFVGNGVRFHRPLYIKAIEVRKGSDFVISEYSASLIISAHRRYGVLSEGAVFFIID